MAADVTQPTATAGSPPEQAASQPRFRPFRKRFALIYAGLAVALGAGIAGLVTLLTEGSSSGSGTSEKTWSGWEPQPGGEATRLGEIVRHVTPTYRLSNGDLLLHVLTKRPPSFVSSTTTLPVRYVAVKGVPNPDSLTSTNSVLFAMCGPAESCSIGAAEPAVRVRLVRREALELALYTFKYVDGVDYVVALIPPKPRAQPELALYFRRTDLMSQLNRPLDDTLATKPPSPATITSAETSRIDRLAPTYRFQLGQAQTGDIELELQPAA
jgi:hypothetical protein